MTTDHPPARTKARLQSKLFWSHLGVMFLALFILVLVVAVVGLFLSDVGPRGGRSAAGRALLTIVISGIATAALAASVMARLAARRITEPIQAASDATRRMASGNYAVRATWGFEGIGGARWRRKRSRCRARGDRGASASAHWRRCSRATHSIADN